MVSIDYLRSARSNAHQPLEDERPAKRISTPAGQRLSVILDSRRAKSPSATAKISVTTTSTYCNDPNHTHIDPVQHGHKTAKKAGVVSVLTGGLLGDAPRESCEAQSHNGSNLSVSVWSDKAAEKFVELRQRKRGGFASWSRRRIAIVIAIIVALIVALAVGLAVGLKKGTTSRDSTSSLATTTSSASTDTSTSASASTNAPSATTTNTLTPSATPSGFPVGSYSLITFLDLATTTCTSSNDSWACAPFTSYYADPQKALAVFNWKITGSSGSYKISSNGEDAILGTQFQNEQLTLLDSGKDSERYWFQISRTKTVNVTGSLGSQRGSFECDYDATTITGSLYTKLQRKYPDDTISVTGNSSTAWPFAARVEQNAGGGSGIPACTKSSGDQVSLSGQDPTTLCSCLYKNWTPTV